LHPYQRLSFKRFSDTHLLVTAIVLLVVALAIALTSCAAKTTMHAGAINQTDSDTYDALIVVQASIDAAKVNPIILASPSAVINLNMAFADYNVAYAAYLAYHAGESGDLTTLTAEVTAVITDIAAMQKTGAGAVIAPAMAVTK
jgi:hypothetical protein